MTSALRVDHLVILVTSLERSMPYYGALMPLLGFSRHGENDWSDGAGFIVHFQEAAAGTRPYERRGAGMNHIGFRASSPAVLERVRDGMRAAGFEAPEVQGFDGAEALFMKDPDGIRFEISFYAPEAAAA